LEDHPHAHDHDETDTHAHPKAAPAVSRRHAWGIMLLLVGIVSAALGTGIFFLSKTLQQGEEEQFAQAEQALKDGKHKAANEEFKRLVEQYPNSDKHPTYVFLEEWSGLAARMEDTQADPLPTLDALQQFLKAHRGDPLLKGVGRGVGAAFVKLVEGFAQRNANPTSSEPLKVTVRMEEVRLQVRRDAGKEALGEAEEQRIDKALKSVREGVERWERRNRILTQLRGLKPTADGIREALRLVKEGEKEFPDLPADAEVTGLLNKMYEGHLAGVLYEEAGAPEHRPVPAAEGERNMIFDPPLLGTPGGAPAGDPVVLALARGVLYALHQSNGAVKWARRVGIDTTSLPVRVPPSAVARERILVLSSDSDTATLTAMDDDGNQLWQYRLGSPCLGRPVVVDQRAYLPTYDGVIHEIELARGGLIGRYHLGQHLTTGGVYDPGEKKLYFPAENTCVYVLDVAQHRCDLILYTNHPTGSLRSEPVLIPSVTPPLTGGAPTPALLVLNQADGLDAIRLRVFVLPLTDKHQAPIALKPEPRLDGWTWFRPARDDEKLVALSDRGVLGLFGIKQPNTKDQELFPMLGTGGVSLNPFLPRTPADLGPGPGRGRAQVVQVHGDDVWVLARGHMQRLAIAWNERAGPRPVAVWKEPQPLGSPLHASQMTEDALRGRSTLFVVTQPLHQQTCVATAVNDEDGTVLWQTQLGLVCQGAPLHLAVGGGPAEPLLLALDQGGSLFALDPSQPTWRSRDPWLADPHRSHAVAPSLTDNPRVPSLLLPGPDGRSILEIACPGAGTHLHVRQVEWAGKERRLKHNDRLVPLPSALAGTPAVVGKLLLVPLAGGSLARLSLPIPADARLEEGPSWRPALGSPDSLGHVVALGGDLFLTTDGGRGLTCWEWPAGKPWQALMAMGDNPTLTLQDRVVSAPAVLPAVAGKPPRVCVADSNGAVTLLSVRGGGALESKQTWDLRGQVTAGPFVRSAADGEPRIGCVVDGRRLVWLDPRKPEPEPVWEYQAKNTVIGQPQVVEGVLVVADQSGHIAGLDLATGRPVGPGHALRGSVVPAASPAAFGPQRLFVPLSDGTAVLLTMDRLYHPLRQFPPGF
jgi:hypothetical protein